MEKIGLSISAASSKYEPGAKRKHGVISIYFSFSICVNSLFQKDGVGLLVSQSTTPSEDLSCFVQPTQEVVGSIESISDQAGDRLVLLMNPQWRIADDALDAASKNGGIFKGLASFLGGKGGSLQRLSDLGFEDILTLEGYVCKGGDIRLAKRFDSDWVVFAANDDATGYIKIGTSKIRPTYQDVDAMLDENGIGLKYARDFGMAPKI